MTVATIDGDAGLCSSSGAGVCAPKMVVSSSSRHIGHTSFSCIYLTRSTFAGITRISSRTKLYPRCSIGAPQSVQKHSSSWTGHSTSRTGRDPYRSALTDFGLRVRVCSLTVDVFSSPGVTVSSALSGIPGVFSLEVPNIFRLSSARVSSRFAIMERRSETVSRNSRMVSVCWLIIFSCRLIVCRSVMFDSLSDAATVSALPFVLSCFLL